MSMRTTLKSVKFNNSFQLNGVESTMPAGIYLVETEEESFSDLSFPAYRRSRTLITVPTKDTRGWQVFAIDPQELEAALSRDVNETENRKRKYLLGNQP